MRPCDGGWTDHDRRRPHVAGAGRELQALAQTGLAYCKDPFDRERYERIRAIAVDMLAMQADVPAEEMRRLLSAGYPTPKLDTRAAIATPTG
mgnify:FL=1